MKQFDFPVNEYRAQFPILQRLIDDKPLIYLDNAATTQKPRRVIEKMNKFCYEYNANIHRGAHYLTEQATEAYETARTKVSHFIHAKNPGQCIFVKGTTEGINLVAHGFESLLKPNDEIIVSQIEHHANIVPWQQTCLKTGAKLKVIPCFDNGELDLNILESLMSDRTKLLAITHVANAIGTVNPVKDIIQRAHAHHIPVLIDGAQAVPHMTVDVQDLDCEFYVFSGHKLYGPTGIGVLYGKAEWLDRIPPYQTGGEMITSVTFEKSTFKTWPYKFEAGTPPVIEAVALGEAVDFLTEIGLDHIHSYENKLLRYATNLLGSIPGLQIIGQAKDKACIISFTLDNIHPHDIGTVLNHHGIAVRTGRHCAEPTMTRFGVVGTTRISTGLYNTYEELDKVVEGIQQVITIFRGPA
jgi:cysteine desulfurase / selenocysteine lyase